MFEMCRLAWSGLPDTSQSADRLTITRWYSPRTKPHCVWRDADIETLLEIAVSPEQPCRGPPGHPLQPW